MNSQVINCENIKHLQHCNADEIICLDKFGDYLVALVFFSPGSLKIIEDLMEFGSGDECYKTKTPDFLIDKTLQEALIELAQNYNYILLALETEGKLIINPKFPINIKPNDYLYVVSESEPSDSVKLIVSVYRYLKNG